MGILGIIWGSRCGGHQELPVSTDIQPLSLNSSVGRAADLIYTCQVRCHGFDSRCFPHI